MNIFRYSIQLHNQKFTVNIFTRNNKIITINNHKWPLGPSRLYKRRLSFRHTAPQHLQFKFSIHSLNLYLRWHHKRRRKQRRYGSCRGLISGRVSISKRPEAVDNRKLFGEWEGNTLFGLATRFKWIYKRSDKTIFPERDQLKRYNEQRSCISSEKNKS